MSRDLLDLVRGLNTLNDDNLADRVIANSDVQWCLSELQDILEEMPTLTQPNEPLTIEQLREMGGQPVYMPETNCWALVTQNAFCPILTFPDGEKCSVYDWYEQVGPVYRCPPEEDI